MVCKAAFMATTTALHPAEAIARLYGWSNVKLAEKAGMSRETLRRRLNGRYPTTWPETLALAHALDVEPQVLTDMTDEDALRHVLDSHMEWRAKRWLLASPERQSHDVPHTEAA